VGEVGHWGKYRENMFVVPDEVPSTEEGKPVISGDAELMALKPMNCPAHVQVFKQGITSYRELPLRLAEFGCCHRNEPHGALHGIMRVRQFTQDDAHIFCTRRPAGRRDQGVLRLLDSVYRDLGFADYAIKLATRPDERFGSDEDVGPAERPRVAALKEHRARLGGAARRRRLLRRPSSNSI
jgi:threonyl-tRNA synthetase